MTIVSVLMPVFNRETLVADAIRSIQNQTFQDWELLILDDASSDHTLEVCKSYEAGDLRIRVFANKNNLGVGRCRNRLLSLATGKYIAIQDSDDVSVPERLEREVRILESKPEVGLVSGVVEWFDFDENRVIWRFPPYLYGGKQYPQNRKGLVRCLYLSCDVPNAACMFRLSLVKDMLEPYGQYRVNEDWYFLIRLAHQTLAWGIPEVIVRMNRGKNHTHLLTQYIWSLREAHNLKHHLYELYKNDPGSPINYILFRRSTARLLNWEGGFVGGWKGVITISRALIQDPFYTDAWRSLWKISRRAFRKGIRLATGFFKKKSTASIHSGI